MDWTVLLSQVIPSSAVYSCPPPPDPSYPLGGVPLGVCLCIALVLALGPSKGLHIPPLPAQSHMYNDDIFFVSPKQIF